MAGSSITANAVSANALNVTGSLQFYGNALIPIGCIMLYYNSSIPAGWALCNGQTVTRTDGGGSITTPNLVGQFVYGGSAANTSPQGVSTITLSTANLPSHNHGVTDNGHNHTITDPGHNHTATDAGHNHTITDPGHKHDNSNLPNSWSVGGAGPITFFSGAVYYSAGPYPTDTAKTGISLSNGNASITVANRATGISLGSATTGISIQNTGSGTAFSIMPPYIVLCYIMKY